MQPSYFILWWAARLCKTFLALQYLVCRIIVFYCCGFLHLSAIKSPNFLFCCYNPTLRKRDMRLRCRFWYVCYIESRSFMTWIRKDQCYQPWLPPSKCPLLIQSWQHWWGLTSTSNLKLKMLHFITTEKSWKLHNGLFAKKKAFIVKKSINARKLLNWILYCTKRLILTLRSECKIVCIAFYCIFVVCKMIQISNAKLEIAYHFNL